MFYAAFPDIHFRVDDLLAEGDLVAARVTVTGTHQGEFMGIPATGRSVEVDVMDFVSYRDGKGTAHWGVSDMVSLLQQLGVMPPPGG
jgi:predicted ester cyclase